MKNQKTAEIETSQPPIFEQLEMRLKAEGFADDHLEVDRYMIELQNCRDCARKLHYKGLSNSVEYHAYGWCECGHIKKFWAEKCVLQRRSGKYKSTVS